MFGEIRNAKGERIDFTFTPGAPDRRDLVVIGHGVTGNKDRPWAVALAESLAQAGLSSLRISFAGNGSSAGDFRDATVSNEVEDLGAVLDRASGWRVIYAGHSMGGAVGVLRASRDERIAMLISLAGMVDTAAFAQRKFGDLQPGIDLMWDDPDCPLSNRFMNDMRDVGSVAEVGSTIEVPWLLVHGTADEVVPIQDSLDIVSHAGSNAELVQLTDVDHVFSGQGTPKMTATVVSWLHRQL